MAGERKFITENVRRVLLKEYLKEQVKRAGFGGVDIQRTPMGTRVTLITERPGLVIGRKGSSIKALTDSIEFDYGFDKPQVEVVEVENPNLSAQIMAEKLASALERGWHFRRAGHSTVRRIMENGARGCQVIIAGKLTGQRHRTEKFKEGHIKFCGEPKLQWMEEGYTPAKLKQGVIGVKVQIMHPKAKLPDEVEILERDAIPKPASEPAPEEDGTEEPKPDEPDVKVEPKKEAPAPKEEKKSKKAKKEDKAPAEEKKVEVPKEDKPPETEKPMAEAPPKEVKPPEPEKPKDEAKPEPKPEPKKETPAEKKPEPIKEAEKPAEKPTEAKKPESKKEMPAEEKPEPEKEVKGSVEKSAEEKRPAPELAAKKNDIDVSDILVEKVEEKPDKKTKGEEKTETKEEIENGAS